MVRGEKDVSKNQVAKIDEKTTWMELVKQAEKGDTNALKAIRAEYPGVLDEVGDLAHQAELSLIRLAAGENELLRESLQRKTDTLRAELAGSGASPLEKLLIQRVVTCWLWCAYFDALYAQGLRDMTREWSEFHQRRQNYAHKRYLAAVKSLATVRRLQVPALQVNIAQEQVNVVK